jgi:hypothetical protein
MQEKVSDKIKRLQKIEWVEDPNMPDYGRAPFFIKKNKEAAEFLRKHGLPEELKQKEGK